MAKFPKDFPEPEDEWLDRFRELSAQKAKGTSERRTAEIVKEQKGAN